MSTQDSKDSTGSADVSTKIGQKKVSSGERFGNICEDSESPCRVCRTRVWPRDETTDITRARDDIHQPSTSGKGYRRAKDDVE